MSEDVQHEFQDVLAGIVLSLPDRIFNKDLIRLEDTVVPTTGHTLQFNGLPSPMQDDLTTETNYNKQELQQFVADNECKLTYEQRTIY